MLKVINFIERITKDYGYKRLDPEKSKLARDFYARNLPSLEKDKCIFVKDIELSKGFERIVIGDYGAYIEINADQINIKALKIESGQAFRTRLDFKGKYIWYTTDAGAKIYHQLRGVSYADYKPGKFYISPYDISQK